jgi:EAL domain-containing protein (putative c-di-GMP-specific phosphodiesterase class I)
MVIKDIIQYQHSLSVNLSISDLLKTKTIIKKFIERHPDSAELLTVEILENELTEQGCDKLTAELCVYVMFLKDSGVKIAIDDFGIQHSNFNRLLLISPNIIKIDGALITTINKNQYSRDIILAIVDFAKKHNIKTVAEYVEDSNIYSSVVELGIDYSQGYYFGMPKTLEENIKKII